MSTAAAGRGGSASPVLASVVSVMLVLRPGRGPSRRQLVPDEASVDHDRLDVVGVLEDRDVGAGITVDGDEIGEQPLADLPHLFLVTGELRAVVVAHRKTSSGLMPTSFA